MDDPLRVFVRPDLSGAPLLLAFEGWNDAGAAASTAVRFVERALHAVPLAEIDCEEFFDFTVARPTVRFEAGEARELQWPHTRFSFGGGDGSREIVMAVGSEPHLRWRRYADAVARLVGEYGIRRVVMLGAFLADVVYSLPVGLTGFATDGEALDRLGVVRSAYHGPTGVVGVLADRLAADGVEVVSLWAGLPHYINASPNPRGALALLQKTVETLDLKLDLQTLAREAASFEERVSALVADDPELGEYVRQLKKREFAQ